MNLYHFHLGSLLLLLLGYWDIVDRQYPISQYHNIYYHTTKLKTV